MSVTRFQIGLAFSHTHRQIAIRFRPTSRICGHSTSDTYQTTALMTTPIILNTNRSCGQTTFDR